MKPASLRPGLSPPRGSQQPHTACPTYDVHPSAHLLGPHLAACHRTCERLCGGRGSFSSPDKWSGWVSAWGLVHLLREPASSSPRTAILHVALPPGQDSSQISRHQVHLLAALRQEGKGHGVIQLSLSSCTRETRTFPALALGRIPFVSLTGTSYMAASGGGRLGVASWFQ